MTPILKSPADCTEAELAGFAAALTRAGETSSPTLAERIRHAERLAFLGRDFEAVGALKRPSAEHCRGVFKRAAAHASPNAFSLELGWLTGDAAAIAATVEALSADAGERAVFVISRADDAPLQAVLERCGFHADGTPYASPRGAYSNTLYVRP